MADKRGLRNATISWSAWHTAGGDVYRVPSAAGSDEIRRRLRQHMSMPAVCIQLVETVPKTAWCTWDGAWDHYQRRENDSISNVALCHCCLMDSLATNCTQANYILSSHPQPWRCIAWKMWRAYGDSFPCSQALIKAV